MAIGLVGRKIGMTRLFDSEGVSIPVSVIEVQPNMVTQIKKVDTDGYNAIQIATGKKKTRRVPKSLIGHYAKAEVECGTGMWEFRIAEENKELFQMLKSSSEISLDIFTEGQVVDVTGTTKGKGFAGAIKRHNFATQDATHGNSLSHRAPGSIGQRQSPGKVFKGKKMAGHLGNVQRTIQNLKIVQIDKERKCLLISGAIPGSPGCTVIVKPAVKAKKAN